MVNRIYLLEGGKPVLRDDGINYSDYMTGLVLLLFIKMESKNVEAGVMTGHKLQQDCRWSDLEDRSGMSQYSHYRQMLEGKQPPERFTSKDLRRTATRLFTDSLSDV